MCAVFAKPIHYCKVKKKKENFLELQKDYFKAQNSKYV